MKKLNQLICLLTIFIGFSTLNAAPMRTFADIKASKVIKVETEGAFPPFNIVKGKTFSGFEIDIFNAMAAELGLKTEWNAANFDSLLIGLSANRYDAVIASHGITEERQKAVDFTNPHYCTGGIIVSLAGGPKTAADLKGKTIAVQVGTTYLTSVQKVPGVGKVNTYPKDTDAMQNLVSKRAAAWVTDKFVALQASKEHKELKLGDMLFTEKIAIAVAKGNTSLKDALDEALVKIQKNGTYKKISEKYFGQNIACPTDVAK